MRSNQEMMKRFAEIAPAIGLLAGIGAMAIAFYAGQATALGDQSRPMNSFLKPEYNWLIFNFNQPKSF